MTESTPQISRAKMEEALSRARSARDDESLDSTLDWLRDKDCLNSYTQYLAEDAFAMGEALLDLFEQLQSAETTLAHAEEFIEHQDMSYRWAEWCEGRNPASRPN